jgi:hypothetical protein
LRLLRCGVVAAAAAGGHELERHSDEGASAHWRASLVEGARRWRCQTLATAASATMTAAPARIKEPLPSAKLRAWPEKRTPKLTIGSSATVAVSPKRSRAQ